MYLDNIPPCEVKYSDFDVAAHPIDHKGEPNKYVKDYTDGAFKMDHVLMRMKKKLSEHIRWPLIKQR